MHCHCCLFPLEYWQDWNRTSSEKKVIPECPICSVAAVRSNSNYLFTGLSFKMSVFSNHNLEVVLSCYILIQCKAWSVCSAAPKHLQNVLDKKGSHSPNNTREGEMHTQNIFICFTFILLVSDGSQYKHVFICSGTVKPYVM